MDMNKAYIFELSEEEKKSFSRPVENKGITFDAYIRNYDCKNNNSNKTTETKSVPVDEKLKARIAHIAKVNGTTYAAEEKKFQELERILRGHKLESVGYGACTQDDELLATTCDSLEYFVKEAIELEGNIRMREQFEKRIAILRNLSRMAYGRYSK